MKKLLLGITLSGVLLAAAHPADASGGARANDAPATRCQDKECPTGNAWDGRGLPPRSDESIQAVFDRHKRALYEIYLRELKTYPTAAGEIKLKMTIAPDGHVSACTVISSTVNSPTLAPNIAAEVRTFNFGAKKGIPSVTIQYGPIGFAPPN